MWYRIPDDAAASGADEYWKVMEYIGMEKSMRAWRVTVLIWMCSTCLHDPDPDNTYAEWRDEGAAGDEAYIKWADAAWEEVRTKPSFQLIQAIRDLRDL